MAKKDNYVTDCGDWHLGWGFGGHNKVGKLRMIDTPNKDGVATFEWKGRSQGRHGQKYNFGAFIRFTSNGTDIHAGDTIKGSAPVSGELLKGVNELLDKYRANNQ